jgi:predicted ABC-type ATPase
LIVAGPNGAGKTTFAQAYLPNDVSRAQFINADLIAGGLSPLKPELAAIAAGRLVLKEIVRLVEARSDFAFEIGTTCCGSIRSGVRQGGHNVPAADVRRRFARKLAELSEPLSPLG